MDKTATPPLTLTRSEAIFAVADVAATVKFYREVLGFEGDWMWGEPPTFAGVRWGRFQMLLCQQPDLAGKIEGHQHYFFCDNIDALHAHHQAADAPIISGIENKPWGMREYTIRDINGYHLRFCGHLKYERPAKAREKMPDFIRIDERLTTVKEFDALTTAMGWHAEHATMVIALRNSLYGVIAVDTREPSSERIVGAIRVVGDGARFFYVQDVMVIPELQNQKIGSAMMEAVMQWLKRTAPKSAYIGLFTGKPGFYERYGFCGGDGMSQIL